MTLALPRIESAGLDGWMVRLFDSIDEANMPWLTALVRQCEASLSDALVDLVPSYTTLLVIFDPLVIEPGDVRQRLQQLLANLEPDDNSAAADVVELPTWYDTRVGPELERIAERAGMSIEQVIEAHSQTEYRVFALGFAPGFAFMGRVAEAIACPRLDTPRRHVPKGSVAIAERQTSAYPQVSPGGWNLIGRTPAVLFDRHRDGFSLLRVGDRVRFVPVSQAEFEQLGGDSQPMEARA
ncbi:5-oxoprolinase subunit PxpB [Halomonas sabkhae]|uniref:5-oxoprolinase subunit PxpB n=1 Tax=Halomonas sabkhae TaxID=626223 RepID=UPI0025B5115E|nr:5-oxoprolinase subunit PxpB [Halomonas sabkhae]MDN3526643.1 5-oxoprolinase subunit PxpB [Halomonas sabkhae]